MRFILLVFTFSVAVVTVDAMEQEQDPPSLVDYRGFQSTTSEVYLHRQKHLLTADEFVAKASEVGVLILDTRSASAFKRIHMKGAMHINFSDFTAQKLQEMIPDKNTCILIYCNNNIVSTDNSLKPKKRNLALNIPTYINLFGYGYKNVYELSSLVKMGDKRFTFVGSAVEK